VNHSGPTHEAQESATELTASCWGYKNDVTQLTSHSRALDAELYRSTYKC